MGSLPTNETDLRRDLLIALALAAITWIVYLPACGFEFVDYDDNGYVFENRHIKQGLTWEGIRWAMTAETAGNWQPVASLSLMLDATLFGETAPGFHFTNIVLHTANTLLLFVLLKRMTGVVWCSAYVAALFAIHPLHVESVAWVSERKDVLSIFFGLISMLAYCRYAHLGGWKTYVAALGTFLLSLASKPMLVTLPFLLLLLDYWPLKRTQWNTTDEPLPATPPLPEKPRPKSRKARQKAAASESDRQQSVLKTGGVTLQRLLIEKVPYLLITLLFSVVAYATQQSAGGVATADRIPPPIRVGNAVLVYILYLKKTFWPVGLAMFYPHPEESISPAAIAVSALLLIAVTVFVLFQWRRRPYLLVGWFWYLGTLIPVIGLVQLGMQQMADRYTYFPLIGFFIALIWFVSSLLPDQPRRPVWLWGVVLVPLICCMVLARQQVNIWQNSETLFRHTLAATDNNYFIHYLLGRALELRERPEDAIEEFQKSLAINPEWDKVHIDMGVSLYALDRVEEAVPHFQAALAINPKLAEPHVNLGVALFRIGRPEEGLAHLKEAVRLDPSNVNAQINMGNALEVNQKFDEAFDYFRRAAELEPGNWLPHFKMAERFQARQEFDAAEQEYQTVVRLNPEIGDAYSNLGMVLLQQGRNKDAVEMFLKALELNPRDRQARQQLSKLRPR